MTKGKKHLSLFLFFTCTLAGFWFLSCQVGPESVSSSEKTISTPIAQNAVKPQFRGPASVPQTTRIPVAATQIKAPVWKEKLEKLLITQGAGQLKSATIEKVDSFNWKIGKVEVPVDSVIVKLEHVKGYRSSFRAIVDSSNGKLLETWDQPHFDNFGSKEGSGIALDPRYHSN